MKTSPFLAMIGAFFVFSADADDFAEFEHPTINFDREHRLPAGTEICVQQEHPGDSSIMPMSECYRVQKPTSVKVIFVIHGLTQPQFFVEPADKRLKHGWVLRSAIVD